MNQGFNQPPVMFNIPCLPGVERITPLLITEVANAFLANANKNDARQFVCNMMSSNNWQNNDFVSACGLAMDMLCLQLAARRLQSPEHGVNEVAHHAALLITCHAAVNNMQLNAWLAQNDQNMLNEAHTRVRELNGIVNAIQQAKSGNNGNMGSNFNVPQQQPNSWGNNGGNMGGGRSTGNPFANTNNVGSMFGNTGGGQQANSGRWSVGEQPVRDQSRIFDGIANTKVVKPEVITTPPAVMVWKQSPDQRYPQAFNKAKEKLVLEQTQFHGSTYVTSTVEELENSMDRKVHQMSASAGAHYAQIPALVENRAEETATSIKRYAAEAIPDVNSDTFEEIIVNYSLSYDKAIGDTRVSHMSKEGANYEKSILVCTWDIPKPFATFESNQEVLNSLASCNTFKELVVMMATLGKNNTRLIMEVDNYLTKKINSLLCNEFSLHNLRVDSFMDDATGIKDYLFKKEGALYSDAFEKVQSNFISRYLSVPDTEDDIEQFTKWACYPEAEEGGVSVIPVFFEHQVAVVSLGIHSTELNIGTYIHPTTKRHHASQITPSSLPMLYDLVETVFKSHQKQEIELTTALIVTGDNKMYELYRGRIGGSAYLIRPY